MYIVSMTTIPSRKKAIVNGNLKSILGQSFKFDKLVINVDDYLSHEDYEFYFGLKNADKRIEINICDKKWRSCNKLIPTLKKYPNDVIITMDDDLCYPVDCISKLVEKYKENQNCIISLAVAPLVIENGKFARIANESYDVKLEQKEFGKYLSNCCLFPPYVFEGTEIFNYDKMFELTEGTHDELWFWINSVLKGIKCIGLKYLYEISGTYYIRDGSDDGYALCNFNRDKWDFFDNKLKELYGEELNKVIMSEKVEFKLTPENIFSFLFQLNVFNDVYKENYILNVDELDDSYKWLLTNYISVWEK